MKAEVVVPRENLHRGGARLDLGRKTEATLESGNRSLEILQRGADQLGSVPALDALSILRATYGRL